MSGHRVAYTLAMSRPHSHLFEVTVTLEGWAEPALDLVLPSWTPGSYMIREYARHVQDFRAGREGQPLSWTKTAKDTWRVNTPAGGRVRASYAVYAHDLSVRTCHLDGTHGFATGAAVFMYAAARAHAPVSVEVVVPQRWQVATGLEPLGGGNGIFRFGARDYDELVDCPIECGTHRVLAFEVDGKPHKIALWGRGNETEERLSADVKSIVESERAFFGGLPYDRYAFLVHLASGRGGLEHRNSAVFLVDRWGFRPRAAYEAFLELIAHELFHVWNVKRIRPKPLGPFDYRSENHTRQLWAVEGITSYYEKRFVLAAGLYSRERFLARLGEEIAILQATPGRTRQSLEGASFDAWIKFYRPDENSVNSAVSYYLKGALAACLLDLEIRAATVRAKCLDDVVRHLASEADRSGSGFAEPDGFLAALEQVAGAHGGAFRRFMERFVAGTDELELERILGHAGIKFTWSRPPAEGDRGAWLGVATRPEGRSIIVTSVRSDGPAFAAGLYAGDEIVALDGHRVDGGRLAARLAERAPGSSARVSVFRRDELLDVTVPLAEPPLEVVTLAPDPESTTAQAGLREAWLSPFQR